MRTSPKRTSSFAALALVFATGLTLMSACTQDETSGRDASADTTAAGDESTTSAEPPASEVTDPMVTEPAVAEDDPEPFGEVAEPVSFDEVAEFGNGVVAEVTERRAVDAKAQLPGEVSGPGVAVVVRIQNGSTSPVDLSGVTVDLTNAAGQSLTSMTAEPASPLSGQLAAGASMSGTYVFRIDPAERADVRLSIKYSSDTPTVVFAGSITDG